MKLVGVQPSVVGSHSLQQLHPQAKVATLQLAWDRSDSSRAPCRHAITVEQHQEAEGHELVRAGMSVELFMDSALATATAVIIAEGNKGQ